MISITGNSRWKGLPSQPRSATIFPFPLNYLLGIGQVRPGGLPQCPPLLLILLTAGSFLSIVLLSWIFHLKVANPAGEIPHLRDKKEWLVMGGEQTNTMFSTGASEPWEGKQICNFWSMLAWNPTSPFVKLVSRVIDCPSLALSFFPHTITWV